MSVDVLDVVVYGVAIVVWFCGPTFVKVVGVKARPELISAYSGLLFLGSIGFSLLAGLELISSKGWLMLVGVSAAALLASTILQLLLFHFEKKGGKGRNYN